MTNQAEIALYANLVLDVYESQEVFRTLLDALSQPGTIHHLPQTVAQRFVPALAPLAALVSHDVPFSICGGESAASSIAVERATFGRSVDPDFSVFIAACLVVHGDGVAFRVHAKTFFAAQSALHRNV